MKKRLSEFFNKISAPLRRPFLTFRMLEAAELDMFDEIPSWVEKGANLHAEYETALAQSSRGGALTVVKYLVEQGADIHSGADRALRTAIHHGHTDVVKYLYEQDRNPACAPQLLLITAVDADRTDILSYFLENGIGITSVNDDAYQIARNEKHPDIVKIFDTYLEQKAQMQSNTQKRPAAKM